MASFDYEIPVNGIHKKFLFDGDKMYLDIKLGKMAFINKRGANEVYEATRIELHVPSEHYITLGGQTPRYPLEMQIYHNLMVTSNAKNTNRSLKVQRAVVSILFSVGDLKEGDVFLSQFGISGTNVDLSNKPFKYKENEYVGQSNFVVASYAAGFNIKALQGLLNIINADHHIYSYYGSATQPPCAEDVFWIVFARPRSISKGQFKFLKNQLVKHVKGKSLKDAKRKRDLFGNKRIIQVNKQE